MISVNPARANMLRCSMIAQIRAEGKASACLLARRGEGPLNEQPRSTVRWNGRGEMNPFEMDLDKTAANFMPISPQP